MKIKYSASEIQHKSLTLYIYPPMTIHRKGTRPTQIAPSSSPLHFRQSSTSKGDKP